MKKLNLTRIKFGGNYGFTFFLEFGPIAKRTQKYSLMEYINIFLGEFQQLQTKASETERFQLYLRKTFNKTASLIAYSCKSNAILAGTCPVSYTHLTLPTNREV